MLMSVPVVSADGLTPPHLVKRRENFHFTYKTNKEQYNESLRVLRVVCMHKTDRERLEEEILKFLDAFPV